MVQIWLATAAAAVPALIIRHLVRMAQGKDSDPRRRRDGAGKSTGNDLFVCERVCTSKRMLGRVGAFSKDPTPNTCVTVCGVSELDACTEACRRTVCVNPHHVPNWNDVCMRRCQEECMKGR